MPRSFGLSAYLTFARRLEPNLAAIDQPRPEGELLWLHCSAPNLALAIVQIGRRLAQQRPGLSLLLTASPGTEKPAGLPASVLWQDCPSENPDDIALFLDHWRPDAGLWLGPYLRPGLISAAKQRACPLFLAGDSECQLENRLWRLIPDPVRPTIGLFSGIFAPSAEEAARLRKQLPDPSRIHASGALLEECPALPVNESDLEELSGALAGRPTWLAARLHATELPAILAAHRAILRLSHRLLLVIVPQDPRDGPAFLDTCHKDGWRIADWDSGDIPDAHTQIVLSSDPRELGLWYRIAPVAFLGSSLTPGHGGQNPLEAAALGSAVLYGPGVRNHLANYSRLAEAGAARIVRDVDSLVTALGQLSAPDIAATMAHAGWEIVSEGADVSDQIISALHDALDAGGA